MTSTDRRVQDVMHKGVIACLETLTLPDAARLMTDENVRALVVTDDACGLCGVLSQSDLVNARVSHLDGEAWRSMTVADVMTRNVLTVTPDDSINEAAKMMVHNHVHRIVVVSPEDQCTPLGVVSMGDLVRDMMGADN
jgi:CBS domain-containing protein